MSPKKNETKLQEVGFWYSADEEPWYPHPKYLIDSNWRQKDKRQIIEYLKKGKIICAWLDYAECRFDGVPYNEMGACDLTDGVWIWPEGLSVYVEKFNVILPEKFVEHMIKNHFEIPEIPDFKSDQYREYSGFWIRWGAFNCKGDNLLRRLVLLLSPSAYMIYYYCKVGVLWLCSKLFGRKDENN